MRGAIDEQFYERSVRRDQDDAVFAPFGSHCRRKADSPVDAFDESFWRFIFKAAAEPEVTPEHRIYPYLLKGVEIVRANQVWSTDITHIQLDRGFCYLVAVMDWFSRYVLAWRSAIRWTRLCVECLEEALILWATRDL